MSDTRVSAPTCSPAMTAALDRFRTALSACRRGDHAPSIDDFILAVPEEERPTARSAMQALARELGDATTDPDGLSPDPASTLELPTGVATVRQVSNLASSAETVDHIAADPNATVDQGSLPRPSVAATQRATADPDATVDQTEEAGKTVTRQGESPRAVKPGRRAVGTLPGGIAGYEILGELGRGGMGVVYKARHVELDRVVALKMVLAGAHASPGQLERFRAEALAVAKLQDPRIVQIFDVGEHDGLPYFSLEFVDGGSLQGKLERKPMKPRDAAELAEKLARGIAVAHDRGIIHRDLKPANILLTPSGEPKITDFGLAKQLEDEEHQTVTGAVMGTPSYMSPEQAWGRTAEIGKPADIYGLGSMLYEFCTGRPPFQGSSTVETLDLVRNREPVPPSQLQPKLPVDLETICVKCLQKEPHRRYETAHALADDLRRFLEGRPILARPVSAPERLYRWAKRNRGLATAIGAAAVLLVAVAGISTGAAIGFRNLNGQLESSNSNLSNANEALAAKTKLAEEKAAGELKAKLEAQENEKKANEARELAQQREKDAKNAVQAALKQNAQAVESNRFLTVLAFDRLRGIPGTAAVRRELLDTAAKGLLGNMQVHDELNGVVAGLNPADPTLAERTLAGIYQRNGRMFLDVNRVADALAQFQKMEAIVAGLRERFPNEMTSHRNFAVAQNNLGEVYLDRLGDAERARDYFLQGLEARKKRDEIAPNDDSKLDLASQHGYLARIELTLGNPEKAWGLYQTESKYRDMLSPAYANVLERRRERAGMLERMGETALRLGRKEDGLKLYGDAAKLREEISRENKDPVTLRHDRWVLVHRLGDVQIMFLNDAEGALESYKKAVDLARSWLSESPDEPRAKKDLGSSLYGVGTAQDRLGRREESAAAYAECLKHWRELASNPAARMEEIDIMLAQGRDGNHAEAARLAQGLITVPPQDARNYFQAACGFTLAAAAAERVEPDKPELARGYRDEALKALALGLKNGWKDRVALDHDPDLDALRDLPEFLALVNENDLHAQKTP